MIQRPQPCSKESFQFFRCISATVVVAFLLGFSGAYASISYAAAPVEALKEVAAPESEGFFSKIGDAFKSLWRTAPAPKEAPKPEEKEKEKEVIHAKRLDSGEPAPQAVDKNPPYKVYSSPPVRDFATQKPSWVMPVEKSAIPPPSLLPLQEDAPVYIPPLTPEENSIASLPQTFFPLFPFSAADHASAQLLPLASSIPLETDHSFTRTAIIFIHDMQRNAAEGVAILMTLAGPQADKPLILAPQFSLDMDVRRFASLLPEGGRMVARWSFDDPWNLGGGSHVDTKGPGVSSFTAIDLLLMFLSDKRRFPSMSAITLVGHGMGADFVQRYAALGRAPDILEQNGVLTRFIVANPSSYMYMTSMRWGEHGAQVSQAALREKCPTYHEYPYGVQALNAYARRTGLQDMRLRYPERRILYLVGDSIRADHYLDRGCEAQEQGETRLSRAAAFDRFLSQTYSQALDGKQVISRVPQVGYDPLGMFGSPCAMAILFRSGICKPVAVGP
ncbi:MAG: hypothetical protein FWF24_01825 [Alphaproteobacteria bacterium]|nr:hypothetical protein [Alphaproteobacteria bacterium]